MVFADDGLFFLADHHSELFKYWHFEIVGRVGHSSKALVLGELGKGTGLWQLGKSYKVDQLGYISPDQTLDFKFPR